MPKPTCPGCGQELPPGLPDGVCANCLLKLGFLAAMPATIAVSEAAILTEHSGQRIGRYKLLEQIGEGGFGTVWMAEQEEPVRRRVALKIIKLGMDTKEVVARFEAERQALAMMDHSNIARVFDGGATESGRPYFVMELVKGVRITDYCDAQKLNAEERLKLFMEVCEAVQHAHQKGIIHRDLKPSNVLVTVIDDRPVPKVIDFGIAKATGARLTEKTFFTGFNQIIGTPVYMSPEQAGLGSLDVDTRSDIYALGVILYELLTGRTPFSSDELFKAGLDEILRTIREKEPPKPSTRLSMLTREDLLAVAQRRGAEPARLNRSVRGDLDWIVMKCLEKDRTRRYESANGLARDLERHLQDEPITAAAPSVAYQFAKFARRHRTGLAVAAAFASLLAVATCVSIWQAVQARRLAWSERQARFDADANARGQALARAEAVQQRQRAEDSLNSSELQLAEDLLAKGESGLALAHLASIVRRVPTNRVAANRLVSALSHRDFALPVASPFEHSPSNVSMAGWFTRDSQWRIARAESNRISIADGVTGQVIATLTDCPRTRNMQVSPDGALLACIASNRVHVWSVVSGGRPLFEPIVLRGNGEDLRFSPDSRYFYGRIKKQVTFHEARTGRLLFTLPENYFGYPEDFSPDGRRFLVRPTPTSVEVRDPMNGERRGGAFESTAQIAKAVFFPDGHHVFISEGGRNWRWNTANGTSESLPAFQLPSSPTRITPSADRSAIITSTGTEGCYLTHTWTGQRLAVIQDRFKDPRFALSFDFSRNGQLLMLKRSWNSCAAILDGRTGRSLMESIEFSSPLVGQSLSPNGRWIGAETARWAGSPVESWRLWQSELFAIEPGHIRHSFWTTGLRIEPESWDGVVISNSPLGETNEAVEPDACEFGALLGDNLALAKGDNTLLLLGLESGQAALRLLEHPVALDRTPFGFWSHVDSVKASPDGRFLVVATDGRVNVWQIDTDPPRRTLLEGKNTWEGFSSDSRFLTTSSPGRTLRIWRLPECESAMEFELGDRRFGGFVPNRHWIFLYETNGVGGFFDLDGRRESSRLKESLLPLASWRFTQDGRRLVAELHHGRGFACWDVASGASLYPPVDCGVPGTKRFSVSTAPNRHGTMRLAVNGRVLAYAPLKSGPGIGALDIETGQILSELAGEFSLMESEVFASDGESILALDSAERPVLWRFRSGGTVVLANETPVKHVMPEPSGRRILTIGVDDSLRLWDAATGQPVSETISTKQSFFINGTFTFLGFSLDSRHVRIGFATQAGELAITHVTLPDFDAAAPEWLADMAEAVGRKRIAPDGSVAFVPTAVFLQLKQRLSTITTNDDYARWMRWFFADRATRTVSPDSPVTQREYAARLTQLNTVESLREVTRVDPGDAAAYARLARGLLQPAAPAGEPEANEAQFLLRHARFLSPGDPETERLCSEVEVSLEQSRSRAR